MLNQGQLSAGCILILLDYHRHQMRFAEFEMPGPGKEDAVRDLANKLLAKSSLGNDGAVIGLMSCDMQSPQAEL